MIMRPVVPTLATAPTKNQLLGQFLAASSERRVSGTATTPPAWSSPGWGHARRVVVSASDAAHSHLVCAVRVYLLRHEKIGDDFYCLRCERQQEQVPARKHVKPCMGAHRREDAAVDRRHDRVVASHHHQC